MSLAYKRRKKAIARGQWDFSRQREREWTRPIREDRPPKFFRYLTPDEREREAARKRPL